MSKYRRITYEDRCQIYALNTRGASQESIAEVLGVSQSAVSREICRSSGQLFHRRAQTRPRITPPKPDALRKGPQFGGLLPLSLMYFLSGEPMHYLSGVDTADEPQHGTDIGIAINDDTPAINADDLDPAAYRFNRPRERLRRDCRRNKTSHPAEPSFPVQPAPREDLLSGNPVPPRRRRSRPRLRQTFRDDPQLLLVRPAPLICPNRVVRAEC